MFYPFFLSCILTGIRRSGCYCIILWVERVQYVKDLIECARDVVSYCYINLYPILLPHRK